ncbi:MAG TPA: impB/mucB/samB family protein [Alphaproteobacteria bacterium]|jgi:DNA polymerase-4|nr:impB/mucB/samB family protein [Alphaproteobacteria bacterium]
MSPPNDSTSPASLRAGCLRWLYVDFNSYFASVEQQLNPALRGRPVIVIPVESDSTCAIAASYEAKAYGIKTGTAVYEAKKMCPDLICVMGKHDMYTQFHQKLLAEIENHIHIDAVCSIDEAACRLMNNETSPARITEIAQNIKRGIARNVGTYIRCSIGAAPNRYLAKVATDLQKPDGFTILPAEDLPHRLFGLSLRDLPGIGANMEKRLRQHGITEVEQLFNYAPKHLRAVWGSIWGEKMWYLLRGIELPEEKSDRRSIGHSHVLAPELRPPTQAYQVAKRLTVKCASRLRRMEYHAVHFSLSVRIENGPRLGAVLPTEPADDNFTFLGQLETLWAAMVQHVGHQRIKKVSVTLSGLVENDKLHHQGDLFTAEANAEGEKAKQKHGKISEAMDRLNKKFGKDTVSLGMLPAAGRSFSGTKIAFTRIPDMEEFLE